MEQQNNDHKALEISKEMEEVYMKLLEKRTEIKRLEEEKLLLEEKIKQFVSDNESLIYKGKEIVSWRFDADKKVFNTKTFAETYPELYEEFLEEKEPTRRFLIKN